MGFSFVNYNFVIFHWQRRILEGTQLQQCVSYEWHTIATCLFGCPRLVASCQFMCTLSYYGWQVCLPERYDMANMSISWHDHISYININIYILCIFMYHLSYIICHTEYMHVMSIMWTCLKLSYQTCPQFCQWWFEPMFSGGFATHPGTGQVIFGPHKHQKPSH